MPAVFSLPHGWEPSPSRERPKPRRGCLGLHRWVARRRRRRQHLIIQGQVLRSARETESCTSGRGSRRTTVWSVASQVAPFRPAPPTAGPAPLGAEAIECEGETRRETLAEPRGQGGGSGSEEEPPPTPRVMGTRVAGSPAPGGEDTTPTPEIRVQRGRGLGSTPSPQWAPHKIQEGGEEGFLNFARRKMDFAADEGATATSLLPSDDGTIDACTSDTRISDYGTIDARTSDARSSDYGTIDTDTSVYDTVDAYTSDARTSVYDTIDAGT